MSVPGKNTDLIKAVEDLAALVKEYDGDRSMQLRLLKQADKFRFLLENPMDTIFKQWETVRRLHVPTLSLMGALTTSSLV